MRAFPGRLVLLLIAVLFTAGCAATQLGGSLPPAEPAGIIAAGAPEQRATVPPARPHIQFIEFFSPM